MPMPPTAAYHLLDAWTTPSSTGVRRDQRYRDDKGQPLTGFIRRDYAATSAVTAVVIGRPHMVYRFPRSPAPPAHPMIRWRHLAMCGGYDMRDEERGRSYLAADAPMREVVAGLKAGTVHADVSTDAGAGFEIVADLIGHCAPLAELFDLPAIAGYYTNVTAQSAAIAAALATMQRETPARALNRYDWANPKSAAELALTGLCLGYPLESTAALILR